MLHNIGDVFVTSVDLVELYQFPSQTLARVNHEPRANLESSPNVFFFFAFLHF